MRRTAAGLLVTMMALVGMFAHISPSSTAHADIDPVAAEQQFLGLINALRVSKGLGTLSFDANLNSVAAEWSQQMADAGTISHNPNFPNEVTSNWGLLGENVGEGYTVQSLFDAFVASPHHYENLVEPTFTRIGIGVVVNSSGEIFTTHDFEALRGTPAPTHTASAPAASSAPRVTVTHTTAAPRTAVVHTQTPAAPGTTSTAPGATATTPAVPTTPAGPPAQFVLSLQQLHSFDPGN